MFPVDAITLPEAWAEATSLPGSSHVDPALRITDFTMIPIAFADPPLLNAFGVHEPLALRYVFKLKVADEIVGWGETWFVDLPEDVPGQVREALLGVNVFATNVIEARLRALLGPQLSSALLVNCVIAGVEVACLDAQGRLTGLPVADLLGGAVRDRVEFSAYLFYKWDAHLDGQSPDRWGAALDPAGIVAQATMFTEEFGFTSLKLKAGALHPDVEVDTILALRDAFPGYPLRIDPNAAWSVETALRAAARMDGALEYYEDPVGGVAAMARVHDETGIPMATNMVVYGYDDLLPAVQARAVQILLSDHHVWGGLRRTQELAVACKAMGVGVSMHSNSHLGITLAAMTHVAATIPNIDHACDTHYPWNAADDIVVPGIFDFTNGSLAVPTGPGLGIEVDEDKIRELNRTFHGSGRRTRDDTGYMVRADPTFSAAQPRF